MQFRRGQPARVEPTEEVAATPALSAQDVDAAELRSSSLFDAAFYLALYPDVAASGIDPAIHYLATGASEGRNPGPNFDWQWYLGECPEAGSVGISPLLHYLRFGREAGYSPKAIDAGQAFDSFAAASRAGALPFAAGYRTAIERVDFPLGSAAALAPDGLPAPPESLVTRIGSADLDSMAAIGRGVRNTILRCLPSQFSFEGARCLDYGCGIGRVLRYFGDEARNCEFWGCDIDGPSIRWLSEQLSPPFRFYRISPTPSLPFEDNSFDLVYAIGVFSQIYDDWHHLAVELRRILRPGGVFIASFPSQTSFEDNLRVSFASNGGMTLVNPFNPWSLGGPLVFVTPDWLKQYWGAIFDVDFIAPNGLMDYDTLAVMRKPVPGSPLRATGRVVNVGAKQAFNADAVGGIDQNFDASQPYLDSYGLDFEPGEVEVRGFIAMREGAERIEILVDAQPRAVEVGWSAPMPHARRPGLLLRHFVLRFEATDTGGERAHLEVLAHGLSGLSHGMSIPLRVRAKETAAAAS